MLLPDSFLAAFLRNYECPACGRRDRSLRLRFPRVRRNPPNIELGFPAQCGCGKADHLKIVMPMLLYGYLLAWHSLVGSERKFGRSEMTINIWRSSSDLLRGLLREYESLLTQTVQQSNPLAIPNEDANDPSAADITERLLFGLNEQQWADFLRRLGIDNSETGGPSEA